MYIPYRLQLQNNVQFGLILVDVYRYVITSGQLLLSLQKRNQTASIHIPAKYIIQDLT